MYNVEEEPRELQQFVEQVQAFDVSMGCLKAVRSVDAFRAYCLSMASRMPDWLGGSDCMRQYVVPHCVRKLWLRVEGLCVKNAWDTTADGRSFTPSGLRLEEFTKFFDNLPLKELLELCPDSAEYLKCLPEAHPIRILKNSFPDEHPLMISAWACLLHDATTSLGTDRCLEIAQKRHGSLEKTLDELLKTRGAELPPNLMELFREIEIT